MSVEVKLVPPPPPEDLVQVTMPVSTASRLATLLVKVDDGRLNEIYDALRNHVELEEPFSRAFEVWADGERAADITIREKQ